MSKDKGKSIKLKRRGLKLYYKYFYNTKEVIDDIVKQYDNGEIIDDSKCKLIFDVSEKNYHLIPDLTQYYSIKLLNKRYIDDNYINYLYTEYSETLTVLKENQIKSKENPRQKLYQNAKNRAKLDKIIFNIQSDDIKLPIYCPYLNILLSYQAGIQANDTPSIDRIIPELGYINGNIQVISFLANRMKNSANTNQLIIFAENVLKIHK